MKNQSRVDFFCVDGSHMLMFLMFIYVLCLKTPFKFSQFGFSENAPPQPKISLIMKYFDPKATSF